MGKIEKSRRCMIESDMWKTNGEESDVSYIKNIEWATAVISGYEDSVMIIAIRQGEHLNLPNGWAIERFYTTIDPKWADSYKYKGKIFVFAARVYAQNQAFTLVTYNSADENKLMRVP